MPRFSDICGVAAVACVATARIIVKKAVIECFRFITAKIAKNIGIGNNANVGT